jgi:sulfite exporter TauE/SafE
MVQSIRPLCIGMAHGLAGSAALMLMILSTTKEVGVGVLSILVFGLGSIIGMMAIGLTISVPVICSRSISQRLFMAVQGVASFASVSVGMWMLVKLVSSAAGK